MPSLAEQAQTIANLYQPPSTGRPSDIGSASTVQQFLEAIGDGNYIETAAKLAGLSKVTVYEWLKRGQAGEAAYVAFANAVERAEARAEAKMVANVRRASELPQFWAAAATHLERRHPDRWSKRQDDSQAPKVIVQIGAGGGDIKVGIIASSSPSLSEDLHRLSPSVNSVQGPINRDYVNQLSAGDVVVPALASETERRIPAGESPGGPYPPVALASPVETPAMRKGRSRVAQKQRKRGRAGA